MISIILATQDTWWITYNNDKSVIHYGKAETGSGVNSGLPDNDPFYYNEAEWLARLAELGITPDL